MPLGALSDIGMSFEGRPVVEDSSELREALPYRPNIPASSSKAFAEDMADIPSSLAGKGGITFGPYKRWYRQR